MQFSVVKEAFRARLPQRLNHCVSGGMSSFQPDLEHADMVFQLRHQLRGAIRVVHVQRDDDFVSSPLRFSCFSFV